MTAIGGKMRMSLAGLRDADWRTLLAGGLLCLPAAALLGVFVAWPFVFGFWFSLHRWDGFSTPIWVGLANYSRMLEDPVFAVALKNNIIFVVLTVIFKNVLGLAVALLLNNVVRGRAFFRTATFIPVTISFVATGLLWSWIYNPVFGLLNAFLDLIGLGGLKQPWLGDASIVLYSIIVVDVWKWLGFHAVLYLAGLQTIPRDVIEVATIDGASRWQRLRSVILPLLAPVVFMNVVLAFSGAFVRAFDLVYVLTQGGPFHASELVTTHMLTVAFSNGALGYAAAIGYGLFCITAVVSAALILFMRRRSANF